MTAHDELVFTGKPGPEMAALLYRTVCAVALARNFPPPEGHATWGQDAVTEVAHDFLVGPRGTKRLADLALRSTSQNSLERLLHTAVLNALRDMSRRTDQGALVLRVRELLESSDLFEKAYPSDSRWKTAGGPNAPSAASPTVLAAAAALETKVTVPRWKSERRRAPLADRASLERLVTKILTAAAGGLTPAEIARALSSRLDPVRVPLVLELDLAEQVAEPQSIPDDPQGVVSRMRAEEIFESWSDRERILTATWDRPLRDLGDVLAVGHSQAAVLRQRLADGLRDALADDDAAEAVVTALIKLSTAWLHHRTTGQGATSTTIDDTR